MNKRLHEALLQMGVGANTIAKGRLNLGGCCVYAALVGRELLKHGIPVRGIAAGEPGYTGHDEALSLSRIRPHVENKNYLNDWEYNANGMNIHHIGLRIGRGKDALLYDSNGFAEDARWLSGERVIPGTLSIPELEGLASVRENWNHRFDRRSIPRLKTLITDMLEDL